MSRGSKRTFRKFSLKSKVIAYQWWLTAGICCVWKEKTCLSSSVASRRSPGWWKRPDSTRDHKQHFWGSASCQPTSRHYWHRTCLVSRHQEGKRKPFSSALSLSHISWGRKCTGNFVSKVKWWLSMMTDCRYDMLWLEGVLRILESWNRQLASCSLLVLAPSVASVLPHVTSSVLLGVTSYIDLLQHKLHQNLTRKQWTIQGASWSSMLRF